MINFLLGIAIGGMVVLIVVKGEGTFRQWEEIKQLKIENENLRSKKEELKNQVLRNVSQINDLTNIVNFHQEQIEHCLEWLSGISTIKGEVELQTHIQVTKRFRQKYGLFIDENPNKNVDKSNDTYISD